MLESLKEWLNNNKQVLMFSLALAVVQAIFAYLLSSKEDYGEVKNFVLLFLFDIISLFYSYKAGKNRGVLIAGVIFANILAFTLPIIGMLSEPMFLKRMMKDVLFFISLPALFFCSATYFKENKITNKLERIFVFFVVLVRDFRCIK